MINLMTEINSFHPLILNPLSLEIKVNIQIAVIPLSVIPLSQFWGLPLRYLGLTTMVVIKILVKIRD
jgi:hypothetical protein